MPNISIDKHLYIFDFNTDTWSIALSNGQAPNVQALGIRMVAVGTKLYLFGGLNENKYWIHCGGRENLGDLRFFATSPDPNGKNDYEYALVHYFDPTTQKWTEVETEGDIPSMRSVFAHAAVGQYTIIFGGEVSPDSDEHLYVGGTGCYNLGPGTLTNEGFALTSETLVWEKFGGDEPGEHGWTAHTTATVYGKKGLLMHGGKRPTNKRTDEMYFYAVHSA
ncbi:hypothetical protein N665_0172s0028 [Sinapis alba]|nr:hypothetical protein N665_0172s0028 [Sinapis alba]